VQARAAMITAEIINSLMATTRWQSGTL